jgi:hypothetical protein
MKRTLYVSYIYSIYDPYDQEANNPFLIYLVSRHCNRIWKFPCLRLDKPANIPALRLVCRYHDCGIHSHCLLFHFESGIFIEWQMSARIGEVLVLNWARDTRSRLLSYDAAYPTKVGLPFWNNLLVVVNFNFYFSRFFSTPCMSWLPLNFLWQSWPSFHCWFFYPEIVECPYLLVPGDTNSFRKCFNISSYTLYVWICDSLHSWPFVYSGTGFAPVLFPVHVITLRCTNCPPDYKPSSRLAN